MIFDSDGNSYDDLTSWHLNSSNGEQEVQQQKANEPKKIYFVRHGETDLNKESGESSPDQPVRGWSNVPLNDQGIKEARKAAESVKDLPIEHIVASDLPRAKQTANIIGNKLNVPVEFDPGLRTWNLGEFTGKAGKEVHDQVDRLCHDAQDERPKGGESFNEFKDRVLSTMSNIVQRHNDKEILVVSHNSPERILHAWTEAGQPQKYQEGVFDTIKRLFKSAPTPQIPDTSVKMSADPRLVHPGMGFTLPFKAAQAADEIGSVPTEALKKFVSPMLSMALDNADEFNKSLEAMKRSPVSQLGFDPSKTFISRDAGETNIAGSYAPKVDTVWSNALYNTNLIHESMHRGIQRLQDANIVPKNIDQELLVRALMLRHFGDIEAQHGSSGAKQVEEAKRLVKPDLLDAVEKAAKEHFNKLHPGLPKDAQ